MEKMPDDIRKVARGIAHVVFIEGPEQDDLANAIAVALSVERKMMTAQFDAMNPDQEELAIQYCMDIAGPRGKPGSPPDPVRLLEMAEALYHAEIPAARQYRSV